MGERANKGENRLRKEYDFGKAKRLNLAQALSDRKDPGKLTWYCIICGKKVSKTYRVSNPDNPHYNHHTQEVGAAVLFNANGNWASSVWDPLDEHLRMEIAICDKCLKPRLNHVYIVKFHTQQVEISKKSHKDWLKADFIVKQKP